MKNISKYHFLLYEELINAFIDEYETYAQITNRLERQLLHAKSHATGTEEIIEKHIEYCIQSKENVKDRLISRLTELFKQA